jgi:hypothetical protein
VASCEDDFVRLWPGAGPDFSGGQPTAPGQRTSIYVLDFDGDPMIVLAAAHADALRGDIGEMERIVSSIRFSEPSAP